MHQADLWDDVSEALMRMFGGRLGKLCSAALEIAAGETDLMANRIGAESTTVAEQYMARKRRVTTSRMIASQAVRPALPPTSIRRTHL
eukprot:SAG11_NODE_1602_length_4600_cov_1.859587_3_plen_88_part_00